jgi:hypothetical protein
MADQMPANTTDLYKALRPMTAAISQNIPEVLGVIRDAVIASEADPLPYEFIKRNQEQYGLPQTNRWRKLREEKPQSQHTGLAKVLQHLTQNGDVNADSRVSLPNSPEAPSGPPVADRLQKSQLWGSINNLSPAITLDHETALTALQSVLPLPQLSEGAFVDLTGNEGAVGGIPTAAATHLPAQQDPTSTNPVQQIIPQGNPNFTLKQESRKRKADDLEDDPVESKVMFTPNKSVLSISDTDSSPVAVSPEIIDLTTPDAKQEVQQAAKRSKTAEKKARKKARAAEAAAQAANMTPFDYASAGNLLGNGVSRSSNSTNGQAQTTTPQRNAKKGPKDLKKQPMNPFAKALDTGTGAKRNQLGKERAGKSMTFQS